MPNASRKGRGSSVGGRKVGFELLRIAERERGKRGEKNARSVTNQWGGDIPKKRAGTS